MAPEFVSDKLIAAGVAMKDELDRIGFEPRGVAWLHFPNVRDWRLTIFSDLIQQLGRPKIYGLLDSALEATGPVDGLTIFDVHLLPTNSAAATALRKFVSSDGDISLRIENCTIDGEPVDAFVYRNLLPRSTREIKKAAQKFEETVKRLPLIA